MPTTQTTFFLLLLYTVLLFPIEAITVSGISSRTGRLASEYWVQGHQIFTNAFEHDDNELGLRFKGFNWYGFESKLCRLGGAWATRTPLAAHIDAMRRRGFNAIRVPLALTGCPPNTQDELENLVETAGDHGMLILLAIETMRNGVPNDTGYIGGREGAEQMRRGWEALAGRFCDPVRFWNVFGADLLNSPHGMSWGPPPNVREAASEQPPVHEFMPTIGDLRHCLPNNGQGTCPPPPPPRPPPPAGARYFPEERWDVVAGQIADATLSVCPRWLAVVEGVGYCQTSSQDKGCAYPSAAGQDAMLTTWWGENLQGVLTNPVRLSAKPVGQGSYSRVDATSTVPRPLDASSKIVYGAQLHAPSTGHQDYFHDRHFPSNLATVWDRIWGNAAKHANAPHAVLVVDWGAKLDGDDMVWQQALIEYLRSNPIAGSFYGAINPDAKSTGGLVTDWEGPKLDERRLDLLDRLPTVLVPTSVMVHTLPPPPPQSSLFKSSPPPSPQLSQRQSPPPPPPPPPSPFASSLISSDAYELGMTSAPLLLPLRSSADHGGVGLTDTMIAMIADDPVGALLLMAVLCVVVLAAVRTCGESTGLPSGYFVADDPCSARTSGGAGSSSAPRPSLRPKDNSNKRVAATLEDQDMEHDMDEEVEEQTEEVELEDLSHVVQEQLLSQLLTRQQPPKTGA